MVKLMDELHIKARKKKVRTHIEDHLEEVTKALNRIAEELAVMNERAIQKEDIYG